MAEAHFAVFPFNGLRQRVPRVRSDKHLAWIRTLPCLITGQRPVDAAHVRYADALYAKDITGKGEKPSDFWAVPLDHDVHMAQHARGEQIWWQEQEINPILVAVFLWAHTGNDQAGHTIIQNARRLTAAMEGRT